MARYFNKNYILSNWNKIREIIFLILLFSYILLRIYNISWVMLGDMIPYFDVLTTFTEKYIFPFLLVVLYVVNMLILKSYEIKNKLILDIVIFTAFLAVSFVHYDCAVIGAFIICSDFTSIKRIAVFSAIGITFGTVCVIVASKTGWTSDYMVPRMGRNAHYFGFFHYAIWARQLLFAGISYLYIRAKKTTLIELIVLAVLSYVIFYYSTQRLTFVCCILLLIVLAVFTKYEVIRIDNKFISSLSIIAFPVGLIGSMGVSYFYSPDNTLLVMLDKFLNTRVSLGHHAFEIFDINLFGQIVHHVTDYYFYLDNGYLYLLFSYGIVLTLITLAILSYMYWRSCKTNNTALFTWLTVVLVYLLVDNTSMDLTCTAVVLLAFPIMLKEHIAEIKKDIK